jgi:ubiquinone/menaquinone biosynthesis C-methylase UbiE
MPNDNSRYLEDTEKAWTINARRSPDRYTAVRFPSFDENTYQSLLREILYYVDVPKQSPILEVGCGNGLLIEQFYRQGYRDIVGCDISTGMIEQARKSMPEVRFFVTDAANLAMFPSESFDLVYTHSIFHYFPHDDEYVKRAIRELFRVTKREGSLMILDVLGSYWTQWYREGYEKYGLREALKRSKDVLAEFVKKVMLSGYSPLSLRFTNPYIFFEALDGENCKIYPLLEVLNTKPMIFKQFRYNVLIRRLR